ncbi:O-succinylbenzoic acid--CoA ligase [Aequorivita sp. H23M31]|uniref:O-succinylbenzoic acid--CoA ligase n=1 Tax=Aequorivita ciconiae TaxID=2494375 RepID=A0A410FZI2_9FLAO|nr:AMP-binding protein [Aequorivita sp. H23M31]QAA80393.1 O-succinylbenzoic acid--CoA ligase [Aequorivita sp. H23M31]
MIPLHHPKFKLNGKAFPSVDLLKEKAIQFITEGKEDERAVGQFIAEWLDNNDFIIVKTSGSTGVPKKIKLNKKHVYNSAAATVAYFNLKSSTRALLCLPSEYIAGKMMLVRAMIAGWDLYITSPDKNPLESVTQNFDFTAMVPYQLHHSLNELHKVQKIIVGGGAISRELENELQNVDTTMFATYGMTETISHIAVRGLNGKQASTIFQALPGVKFTQNEERCLQIHAPAISEEIVITNDVVDLVSTTSFKLLGRNDNVINSGGVKIHPEIVEQKLSYCLNKPFFISSEKDPLLGERVVLVIESKEPISIETFSEIFEKLDLYEKPKKILISPQFIYTETGKIRRQIVLKNLIGSKD